MPGRTRRLDPRALTAEKRRGWLAPLHRMLDPGSRRRARNLGGQRRPNAPVARYPVLRAGAARPVGRSFRPPSVGVDPRVLWVELFPTDLAVVVAMEISAQRADQRRTAMRAEDLRTRPGFGRLHRSTAPRRIPLPLRPCCGRAPWPDPPDLGRSHRKRVVAARGQGARTLPTHPGDVDDPRHRHPEGSRARVRPVRNRPLHSPGRVKSDVPDTGPVPCPRCGAPLLFDRVGESRVAPYLVYRCAHPPGGCGTSWTLSRAGWFGEVLVPRRPGDPEPPAPG